MSGHCPDCANPHLPNDCGSCEEYLRALRLLRRDLAEDLEVQYPDHFGDGCDDQEKDPDSCSRCITLHRIDKIDAVLPKCDHKKAVLTNVCTRIECPDCLQVLGEER